MLCYWTFNSFLKKAFNFFYTSSFAKAQRKQLKMFIKSLSTLNMKLVRVSEISLFSYLNTSFRSCYNPTKYEFLVQLFFGFSLAVHWIICQQESNSEFQSFTPRGTKTDQKLKIWPNSLPTMQHLAERKYLRCHGQTLKISTCSKR